MKKRFLLGIVLIFAYVCMSGCGNADDDSKDETIIYETTADVTHDGTDDLIQVAVHNENSHENSISLLEDVLSITYVKVYRGIDHGKFESSPAFISEGLSIAHTGNGTVCLSHKDGYDYLLFCSMYEGQGYANYSYNAVYISDEDGIVTADSGETSFAVGEGPYIDSEKDLRRDDVIPAFREKIAPWIADASIIVSLQIDDGALISTAEEPIPMTSFFEQYLATDSD